MSGGIEVKQGYLRAVERLSCYAASGCAAYYGKTFTKDL